MKKLRQLVIIMAVLIMSLMLVFGSISTAYAAPAPALSDNAFTISALPAEVTIGSEVDLPAISGVGFKVKDPVGKDVKITSNKFVASQAGYYSVNIYKSGNILYEGYKIKVTVDKAEISVPFNGAEIPTYVSTTGEIKVPVASMVVWDEDDATKKDADATQDANNKYRISVQVIKPDGKKVTLSNPDAGYYTFANSGENTYIPATYTIRYLAEAGVKGEEGYIAKTKDFTVKVQEGFTDTEKPEFLSAINIPNTAAQKTKLTLPIANTSDNYDSNVKVTIKVVDPEGQEVKEVNDEDEKNLVLENNAKTIVFDNNKVMSFYPWIAGPYKVTYTATDDSGNSYSSDYLITVSDNKGPTIEFDSEDVPSTWGLSLKNKAGNITGEAKKLVIAKPEIWDNVSVVQSGDNIWDASESNTAAIRAYLTIRDNSGETVYNSQKSINENNFVEEKTVDGVPSFVIDFSKLTNKTGDFTFLFTARDTNASGKLLNTSTKGFSVKVIDTYTDEDIPTIQLSKLPQYLIVDKKFNEPAIDTYDKPIANVNNSVKANVKYFFKANGETEFEEFDFEDKSYFIPESAGVIKIVYNAVDALGNKAYDTDQEILINVYSTEISTAAPTFKSGTWTSTRADGLFAEGKNSLFVNDGEGNYTQRVLYPNDTVSLSDIVIEASSNEFDFLGYEVIVRKPYDTSVEIDGTPVSFVGAGQMLNTNVLSYIETVEGGKDKLHLKGIEFTVGGAGEYSILIRAFNASGASSFAGTTFTVSERPGDVVPVSFSQGGAKVKALSSNSTVSTSMELGEEYALPLTDGTYDYDYRQIEGPAYELKGNIFVPKAGGTYTITLAQFVRDGSGNVDYSMIVGASKNVTVVNVTDSIAPVFEALNELPTHVNKITQEIWDAELAKHEGTEAEKEEAAKKALYVMIPNVNVVDLGGSMSGKLSFDFKVTDKNGSVVPYEEIDGEYYFRPDKDGVYTITYTANDGYNSKEYTVKVSVGDLINPTVTAAGIELITPASSYKQGDNAYFTPVDKLTADHISDNVTTTFSKFTKTLIVKNPSGEVISPEYDDDNVPYYTMSDVGVYTVTYKIIDEAGNEWVKDFTVVVTGEGKSVINTKVLATVLVITAVVLIVGVGLYFFRFRRVKESKLKVSK